MISINVIGDMISGSYGNTPFSRTYEKDIYEQMLELSRKQILLPRWKNTMTYSLSLHC